MPVIIFLYSLYLKTVQYYAPNELVYSPAVIPHCGRVNVDTADILITQLGLISPWEESFLLAQIYPPPKD